LVEKMVESINLSIDPYVASKMIIASKKLGVDPSELINKVLGDWVNQNKWLTLSVEDVLNEYEKALEGYSKNTKKTKLKIVKSFLEWCEISKVIPNEDAINKYLEVISLNYSQSYVVHSKSTLKDFVEWFYSTWVNRS